MTENETELLKLIRGHKDPEKAFKIALEIILGFLEQDESSQAQQIACSPVSA
jgi:hypothetical protein